ncbi:hypothetical protein [Entomohabitans teleogrylli]|uniref:hypothetical protein n=1 Tax=Entomohabitans teleogrylli TaxID=1384589 RepID=UPI000A91A2BA|nr:hypothetical protein [Entomohabitans teleogrylli]
MKKFTVLLNDDTVGEIYEESIEVGQIVTVMLHDENGNPIKASGKVNEILEETEF